MSKINIRIPKILKSDFKAEDYILHEELKNAIEVAIALNQPLLLTGEPGTGKKKLPRFFIPKQLLVRGTCFILTIPCCTFKQPISKRTMEKAQLQQRSSSIYRLLGKRLPTQTPAILIPPCFELNWQRSPKAPLC